MRASTVFALTLALLIGLGAVVGARWAGWLGKPETRKEVQVLVAARNVFPGDVIETAWVKARALRPEELAEYEKNKPQYLPATPQAAALRVANKPIEADSPILRKDLKEMAKPEPLHERLLPNMRAVNLSVQKDQSAGGLIQVGEWVDVYLTSTITSEQGQETTKTAPVAQSLRVIAKRNALWNVFASLPDNKPVQFTLEANPYRTALLEYAKTKGSLSLVPLSAVEQKNLEERRNKLLAAGETPNMMPVSFAAPAVVEMTAEESRVDAFNRGEHSVGTQDLVRIFDLQTPAPPRSEVVVEQFNGLSRTRLTSFNADGTFLTSVDAKQAAKNGGSFTAAQASKKGGKSSGSVQSFRFDSPDCKSCKTCPGNKKGT